MVEDVDWHHHYPQFFGSVGDDKKIMIWDTRKEDGPVHDVSMRSNEYVIYQRNMLILFRMHEQVKDAHSTDVNCLSFNPFNEFLLATGGLDSVVKLWDMRNMKEVVHEFNGKIFLPTIFS